MYCSMFEKAFLPKGDSSPPARSAPHRLSKSLPAPARACSSSIAFSHLLDQSLSCASSIAFALFEHPASRLCINTAAMAAARAVPQPLLRPEELKDLLKVTPRALPSLLAPPTRSLAAARLWGVAISAWNIDAAPS